MIKKTIKIENAKPKLITFNQEEIEEIIKDEIRKLRSDAVEVFFNTCTYNIEILTKERIEKIMKCLTDENDDEKFQKILNKLLNLAETSKEIDYCKIFNSYLKDFEKQNDSGFEIKIRFIRSQSRIKARCKELFRNEEIKILVDFFKLKESHEIFEIIYNYANHDSTEALSETLLESIFDLWITNGKAEMFFSTILLSAEKSKSLSKSSIQKLIKNI